MKKMANSGVKRVNFLLRDAAHAVADAKKFMVWANDAEANKAYAARLDTYDVAFGEAHFKAIEELEKAMANMDMVFFQMEHPVYTQKIEES
jgi:ornithine cyclodeaminase/alanine dehydrogenase-like protein (mu-crystallin family)